MFEFALFHRVSMKQKGQVCFLAIFLLSAIPPFSNVDRPQPGDIN